MHRRAWDRRTPWLLVLGAVALCCVPLVAHHSFAVIYLETDTIQVEGDVIEFQFKNPHSWVYVQGQDAFSREVKTWAAEWGSTSALDRSGITKNTLRVGDSVHIWASPNKNPSDNRIRLKKIERRGDGWSWGQRGRQDR